MGVCITKDLSRLGRNSSLTGLYINFTFPKCRVRHIAINDNLDIIDPNSTDNDMAGIKNWFNEFFARDTSRKIHAVQKSKGERGSVDHPCSLWLYERPGHPEGLGCGRGCGAGCPAYLHPLHGGAGADADCQGAAGGESTQPYGLQTPTGPQASQQGNRRPVLLDQTPLSTYWSGGSTRAAP